MKKIKIIFPLFLLLAILQPASVYARRDQVDSDQRLQLLQQATGSTSSNQSSNTFEARLNAIMDTSASPERRSVAVDDAQERQRIFAMEKASLEIDEKARPGALETQKKTKISDAAKNTKLDQSQESFDKSRDEIEAEFDERIKKPSRAKAAIASARKRADEPSLSPSLANNPFYFAPDGGSASFQDRKQIIISRLRDITGASPEEAEAFVNQTSSTEELTLQLMREYGFSYGEASDVVS